MVYDDAINAAGGVHVVQTFFSQFLAEEIQIQDRTARQGKRGSYKMIVLSSEIEAAYGPTSDEVEQESRRKKCFYEESLFHDSADRHERSVALQTLLEQDGPRDKVAKIMMSFASSSCATALHIILCLDESGSMSSY